MGTRENLSVGPLASLRDLRYDLKHQKILFHLTVVIIPSHFLFVGVMEWSLP